MFQCENIPGNIIFWNANDVINAIVGKTSSNLQGMRKTAASRVEIPFVRYWIRKIDRDSFSVFAIK